MEGDCGTGASVSQDDKVLAHLEAGNTVTPEDVRQLCGSLAAHSIMARLRKRGYRIDKVMRHDNGKHFGEYFLAIPH